MKVNCISLINYCSANFTGRGRKNSREFSKEDADFGDIFTRSNAGAPSSDIASKTINDPSYTSGGTPAAVFKDTEEPYKKFKSTLEFWLDDLIVDDNHPERPIVSLTVGRKPRHSIKEKMQAKRIRSKKDAMAKIDDLIRARIILDNTGSNDGDAVVTKIIKAIKLGKLKVVEITSYRPDNLQERKKYEYVKTPKVRELAKTARDNGQTPTVKGEEKETGYLAMHIIFLLESGHRAELQIMGVNVARLKEVEDVCFKIKCNKSLDPAFGEVVKAIKKLQADPNLMDRYNLYTKEAYRHERLKERRGDDEDFLKLTDPLIPEILDFNNVARIVAAVNRARMPEQNLSLQSFSS